MRIGCEIISIDEESEIAILNFHMTDEHGKDEPRMVVVGGNNIETDS